MVPGREMNIASPSQLAAEGTAAKDLLTAERVQQSSLGPISEEDVFFPSCSASVWTSAEIHERHSAGVLCMRLAVIATGRERPRL